MEVFFFTRNDCGVCKAMYPIWNECVSAVTKHDYSIVDCDINLDMARSLSVSTLPTFVILNEEGHEVTRKSGFIKQSDFEAWLDSF
jgi:thioredoxin-like negative regulator of GroEL